MTRTRPLLDRIAAWNDKARREALIHLGRGGLSLVVVYGGLACLIQQLLFFITLLEGGAELAGLYLAIGLAVAAAAFVGSVMMLRPGLHTAGDSASLHDPDRARQTLRRIQSAPTRVPTELSEGGRTPLPELTLSLFGLEILLLDAPAQLIDAWICWRRRIAVDDRVLFEAEALTFAVPAPACADVDPRAALLLLRLQLATLRPSPSEPDDLLHVSRRALATAH